MTRIFAKEREFALRPSTSPRANPGNSSFRGLPRGRSREVSRAAFIKNLSLDSERGALAPHEAIRVHPRFKWFQADHGAPNSEKQIPACGENDCLE